MNEAEKLNTESYALSFLKGDSDLFVIGFTAPDDPNPEVFLVDSDSPSYHVFGADEEVDFETQHMLNNGKNRGLLGVISFWDLYWLMLGRLKFPYGVKINKCYYRGMK